VGKKRLLIGGALLLLLIAGASVYFVLFWGESLPFRIISQAEEGNSVYRPNDPAVLVIATPGEVNDIAAILLASRDPQISEQLRQVDYDREFAVLVFNGSEPVADYGITVQQVQRRDSLLIVRAHFVRADPSEVHVQIVTSPYHFVAVTKTGTWGRQVRFVLMDGWIEASCRDKTLHSLASDLSVSVAIAVRRMVRNG
jgi:PrcB C-terminal